MRYLIFYLPLIFSINLYSQISKPEISVYSGNSLFSFWTNAEDKLSTDYGISYIAGIGYQNNAGKSTSIDIRLVYSNNDLIRNESTIFFNCVDIPVTFRFSYGPRKRVYYSLGAFTSIIMDVSVKSYSSQGELVDFYSINDRFKKMNYGFSGSLGYELPIHNRFHICVEANSSLGIRTITSSYNGPGQSYFELKTNRISFLIGVSYQFSK